MLLEVSQLVKSYGPDEILTGVSFRLESREKVALVGRNGVGKTTLLRILNGDEEADGGSVRWARGASIGYLSQHSRLNPNLTVLQEAEEGKKHIVELRNRLAELEAVIAEEPSEDDLEEYARVQQHFHDADGYSIDQDLSSVLARFGFGPEENYKPVSALSGGELTRLTLAKLLLEEPDLLILDEPTNHLDLEATEWLERWLVGYVGSVLLVSHDRRFLEKVGGRFLEMRNGKVKSYTGSYVQFRRQRDEEDARQATVAAKQQKQIDQMDEYVRRFMGSERTAQARGRRKHLEKLRAAASQSPEKDPKLKAKLRSASRSGNQVVKCLDLSVEFGNRRLLQGLDWIVAWGDRWGIIGGNGAGKSTLVKCILGQVKPTTGSAGLGTNVRVGYFGQDAQHLNLEQTPVEMLNRDFGLDTDEARNLLGRFLLSGDDPFRPISTLSGGERNRVALARLVAESPNLLVLDEPTNHLDIDSREALADVLKEFNGTLILISHDRWLLDEVTSQTLDIQRARCIAYPGPYSEYRASRAELGRGELQPAEQPLTTPKESDEPPGARPQLSQRELSKEIEYTERLLHSAEALVASAEEDLAIHERLMASPPSGSDFVALSLTHGRLSQNVADAMQQWEATASHLEALKSLRG